MDLELFPNTKLKVVAERDVVNVGSRVIVIGIIAI
jgi:hypothetical protein